jgi:RNA polymerase sigma factor (TIGR02999 family)
MESPSQDITVLLSSVRNGDSAAMQQIIPLVYGELRKLAGRYMRLERPDHTLQPTALVNEAFLRMAQGQNITWENRAQFFGIAARLMRQILIDHAREHSAAKRGSGQKAMALDEGLVYSADKAGEMVALDDALQRLERLDARQSRIIELRFFGGLTIQEAAAVLGVATSTVEDDWALARAWLGRELGGRT